MKIYTMLRNFILLLVVAVVMMPFTVSASPQQGADLVALSYSQKYGVGVLSNSELFWSADGEEWSPAGFTDRAVRLTGLGIGESLVVVTSDPGTIFRSVDGGLFQEVNPPKDPYGRIVSGIRYIAIHPEDKEILASSGQGLIRSRDKGVTWEPVTDPFWSNPAAREVIAIGYTNGKPVVVTRRGVYRQEKDRYELLKKGLPDESRPTVASVSDGEVLMALPGEGIFLAKKDNKFSKLKSAPGDPIAFLGFARNGFLASRPATELNLGNSQGSSWSPVGQYSPSFIPLDSVSTPYGDFLILRGKGLVKLEGDRYIPIGLPANLSSVNASLVVSGNRLLGTQGGVYFSSSAGKVWEDVTPVELGAAVNVFLPLEDGRILLGSNGAGVFVSKDNGKTWRSWNIRLGTSNTIKGLALYDGGVLAGTENGLVWTEIGEEPNWKRRDSGVGRFPVVSLVRQNDTYWVATQAGVFKAQGNSDFTPVPGFKGRITDFSAQDGVLLAIANGRVMMATGGGKAAELANRPERVIATQVALLDKTPYIGTNKGVFSWDGTRWQKVGYINFPVTRLVPEQGKLRAVTMGAGTYILP
ncbi:MAG: hypothetical protein P1S59_08425 [bacterium]|nr:hypothetical protein [bacterium]